MGSGVVLLDAIRDYRAHRSRSRGWDDYSAHRPFPVLRALTWGTGTGLPLPSLPAGTTGPIVLGDGMTTVPIAGFPILSASGVLVLQCLCSPPKRGGASFPIAPIQGGGRTTAPIVPSRLLTESQGRSFHPPRGRCSSRTPCSQPGLQCPSLAPLLLTAFVQRVAGLQLPSSPRADPFSMAPGGDSSAHRFHSREWDDYSSHRSCPLF